MAPASLLRTADVPLPETESKKVMNQPLVKTRRWADPVDARELKVKMGWGARASTI